MTEAVIEAEGLTRQLAGEVTVTLVEEASLAVHGGEYVAITGASGSGKSSLLYLLGLLDRPTSGRIWLRGHETTNLDEDALAELRLAELGFVFQFHFLLPEFSAIENVMLPMQRLGRLSQGEIEERAGGAARKLRSGGRSQETAAAAFGWAEPAGRHRPCARQRSVTDPGRRADRQSRYRRQRQRAKNPDGLGTRLWPRRRRRHP